MRIVGLTGGIASGKSTVSDLFKTSGIPIVDADLVARDVVRKGTLGWRKVVAAFGNEILLENGEINRARLGQIVFSDPTKRQLLNRISEEEAQQRINAQTSLDWKKTRADIVINNSGLMEDTRKHVQDVRKQDVKVDEEKLQYLEIVHIAAIRAVLFVSSLYSYAKENAGPLRNGVESVEGTVKNVVCPVYQRYHKVPFELLKLADRKMGESVQELERHVPEGVKGVYAKAQKAPSVARSVAGEVQRAGVVGSAAGLAKAACLRAEPAAERLAVSIWRSLNRLPVFPQVAHAVVPAAADLSDRYNRAVSCAAEKGYIVSSYLPLVPTERIAKVFAPEIFAE
ncbi:hypothetical protein HPP92_010697 [Vanilla planifolia]|uniref:Dephospho-CoA kinase n=1 Tax=Vanilla planifolia TaxID=51239 RepID=A0A835QW68_VANPL|nr:hypothetical protein HPP92_010697 [Vanilla planifolia]